LGVKLGGEGVEGGLEVEGVFEGEGGVLGEKAVAEGVEAIDFDLFPGGHRG
jgi:hypothetical protein